MEEMTLGELARNMKIAFEMADMNPCTDSLAVSVEKFQRRGLRHLLLHIENGGLLCLCADPEMSGRIAGAIQRIEDEMDGPQAT